MNIFHLIFPCANVYHDGEGALPTTTATAIWQLERQKSNWFITQKGNFARASHHPFLYISLPSLYDYDVKMPNCKFYGGRKQATTNLLLECGPQEISSREFAYTWHFQQIGINATKIEKTGIHFKSDVFAAVAVVDTKAPYYILFCTSNTPPLPPISSNGPSLNYEYAQYFHLFNLCKWLTTLIYQCKLYNAYQAFGSRLRQFSCN